MILGDLELLRSLRSGPAVAPGPREGLPGVVNLSVPTLLVSEGDPAVEVPEDARKAFADWLHLLLPAPGALQHDLRIVYRLVHYDRGSPFRPGSFAVETAFFDGDGRTLGSYRGEATTDESCGGRCPFRLVVQFAAEKVAEYVRGHFLKPAQ
jgi:hypothetical protein